jgi:hypothetical protein
MAKRDMDLVRSILLRIEENDAPEFVQMPSFEGIDEEIVAYHIRMMKEADLLDAVDASTMSGEDYIHISITWRGHEFLETVRDPAIWQKTKAGAAKLGSFSLSIIGEIAKAAIVAKAQSLGLTA